MTGGTWLHRGPHGTWLRDPAHRAPAGTPTVNGWLELDLSSGLYDASGVVVVHP